MGGVFIFEDLEILPLSQENTWGTAMDNFGNSNKCAALGLQMRDGNTQMETAIRGDAAGQGQIGLIPERKPVPGWLIGLEVLTAICIATLTAGFIWPDCPPPRCIDADVECSAYLSECLYVLCLIFLSEQY